MKPRLPTVADYMTREVLTVRENTPVLDAVEGIPDGGVNLIHLSPARLLLRRLLVRKIIKVRIANKSIICELG